VRSRLGIRRVGHAGTLDPFANGLLIVMINKATRLFDYLSDLEKVYEGVMRLGERTDTDDRTGVVVQTSDAWTEVGDADVSSAMSFLVGRHFQTPPVYSAKKVQGQPAHRRARRGEDVELTPKEVAVSTFESTGLYGRNVGFRVGVSTGTYIRALARDLGERLGCGAHLTELRRIFVGPFAVSDAAEAAEVSWGDVKSPNALVAHLQSVVVDAPERDALRQGKKISWEGPDNGGAVAVFTEGNLVAIAVSQNDGLLHPRVVLGSVV